MNRIDRLPTSVSLNPLHPQVIRALVIFILQGLSEIHRISYNPVGSCEGYRLFGPTANDTARTEGTAAVLNIDWRMLLKNGPN